MESDILNRVLDKRGELRLVLICKVFFFRVDFMKIKFVDLLF